MDLLHSIWDVLVNFLELFIILAVVLLVILFIYDKYVQRKQVLLINYLVIKQGKKIGNYYNNLIKSSKVVLAVMGKKSIKNLDKSSLTYTYRNGKVFFDIHVYFRNKLHL